MNAHVWRKHPTRKGVLVRVAPPLPLPLPRAYVPHPRRPVHPTAQEIVAKLEYAVSVAFPDSDPLDHLMEWMERHGIGVEHINRALRKTGRAKSYDKWMADMWDDCAGDRLHDARNGHVDDNSPFYRLENDTVVPNPNPWKPT